MAVSNRGRRRRGQAAWLVALLALALGTAAWVAYRRSVVLLEAEVGRRAMGVALAVAQGVDLNQYRSLQAAGRTSHPYLLAMQERLRALRQNQEAAFIYSEERVGPQTIRYILDADPPGGPAAPGPFEEDVMDATSARAHAMGRPLYGPITRHPIWGALITGYAPIYDEEGKVLGVVGVDFRGSVLEPLTASVLRFGLIAAAAGAAAAAAAGWALGWAGWSPRRRTVRRFWAR